MDEPLQFGAAVLMGFGVLELILGPFVARTTGMPAGTTRVFILTGLVTIVLGISMFWFSTL